MSKQAEGDEEDGYVEGRGGGEKREVPENKLFASCGSKAHSRLEGVVDPPLETSKSSNHEYTSAETLSGQVGHSNLVGNLLDRLALVGRLKEIRKELCR